MTPPTPVPLLLAAKPPQPVRKPLAEADFQIVLSESFRERFERLIQPTPWGCVEWQGATNGNPYGKVRIRVGLTMPTHCAAWIMHYGQPIPEYLELDHTCVNSMCVNVDHLEAVTSDENKRRAFERSKVRVIRSATMRLRRGKYQVRWRELVDGAYVERGRTIASRDEAERFMASLPNTPLWTPSSPECIAAGRDEP